MKKVALLLGAVFAFGQNPQVPETAAADRCAVEGTVTNAATGEPLRKAGVVLRRISANNPITNYTATSDAAGHYSIADLEPGNYMFTAERSGFVTGRYGAKSPTQGGMFVLRPGEKLKDANFKLLPHGVVTGRVLDEDGDPLNNVTLQLLRNGYVRGKKQLLPASNGSSNDLGEFRLAGVPPGRYVLSATYRQSGSISQGPQGGADENYAPTYYPAATSQEAAAFLEVASGQTLRGIDIRMLKTRTVRIRGQVVLADNKSPQSVMVMLQPRAAVMQGMPTRNTTVPYNAKGEFVIANVLPGPYHVIAVQSEGGRTLTGRAAVDVGNATVEGITLQLAPGMELNGKLKIEGPPIDPKSLRVMLNPKNMSAMVFGPTAMGGTVKEDLTFTLSAVQPELYDVRLTLPAKSYIKSLRAGDAEAVDTGLDLSSGAPPDLQLTIAQDAGELTGTVQTEKGEPAPNAAVVLVPEGKRREADRYYLNTTTDKDGRFTMATVIPGEYRLYAFDALEAGAHMDPEWMKPYESKGEKLTVGENSHESRQLKLISSQ